MDDERVERVERVARALCKVDDRDPDQQKPTGRMETVRSGDSIERRPVTICAWQAYEKEAQRFIAAFDAAHLPHLP